MENILSVFVVLGLATILTAAPPAATQPASPCEVYQAWPFNAKEAARRQEETAKALGVSKDLAIDLTDKAQMKLLLIPAGKFMMGVGPKGQELMHQFNAKFSNGEVNFAPEGPVHEVTITKPFYMGLYNVTRGQFAAFVADSGFKTGPESGGTSWGSRSDGKAWVPGKDGTWKDPGFEQADDHPVVSVNWNDAMAFCKWMSKKTGRTITLPTEAQWEHACRAGVATMFLWGDDPAGGAGWLHAYNKTTQAKQGKPIAVFPWADGYIYTAPVGKFKPNNFGLYDMMGNAGQWCADWWDMKYYQNSPKEDPPGGTSGPGRVSRGGSWNSNPPHIAARPFCSPDATYSSSGFRVICTDIEKK